MNGVLWATVVVFVVSIVAHFSVADYGKTSGGLLLAIIAAGVLVGFAEETLFRGIMLRALRTNLRPEAWVMLITSVWFVFRRVRGLLVLGMVAHALWDMGAFLPAPTDTLGLVDFGMLTLALLSALIAAIVILRNDRRIAMTPAGIQDL
jgi:membrane protease YdiL (CAAX protease family)